MAAGATIAKMLLVMLVIINICVWVVGVVLIFIGSWVIANSEEYTHLFGDVDTLTLVAGIVIGIGSYIFLLGFSACFAAIKENTCLLKLYFALVLGALILQIVAGILAFVYQGDLTAGLEDSLKDSIMKDYGSSNNNAITNSIDAMQINFKCCGSTNITDWAKSVWAINERKAAPVSCCKTIEEIGCNEGVPGIPLDSSKINTSGCVDGFTEWLTANYVLVGAVCLGLMGVEILAMILTSCLNREIDRVKVGPV